MVSFEEKNRYHLQRQMMIENHLKGRDISDPNVLDAMQSVHREAFVPDKYAAACYDDNPLPIGMGQTISQPYIVALMTQCLELTGAEEVLEIGTGSGYQTAILASLASKVYTIERFNELSEIAQGALGRQGFENIEFCIGDGSCGWPDDKQFDRIIVTAAVPDVPDPLAHQMKDGGMLAAPIGGEVSQELMVVTKNEGCLQYHTICGCRFVKLIGQYGFKE